MGQSVIAVALVLGGLIFFHELGHFLIARLFGIGVATFSLGFGPRLAGFKGRLTEYRLSAVPLGGYRREYTHLATMSFGQGVAASPLQITAAFAAVANGGMLMKPLLVRRVIDEVPMAAMEIMRQP